MKKLLSTGMLVAAVMIAADAPGSGPIVSFSATTANVQGAPDSIRIDIFRWSTDAERDRLMSAWTNPSSSGGGRGTISGKAGRGAKASTDAPPAPPVAPEVSLAAAIKQAPGVGYLWSSEVAGYGIRYAGKLASPDGSQRMILITDRRLGKTNTLWTPASGTPSTYDFSVIELRVNPKGEGEGRISLTGGLAPDSVAKIVVPRDYATLPVILKNVKRREGASK